MKENKLFDYSSYVFFSILNRDIKGTWGFTSYQDADGNWYKAINGYAPGGVPRAYDVFFSPAELLLRVPKGKKISVLFNNEEKKMLLADYIRNCSFCEGSPNNRGKAMFKEVDEEKDAGILIDAKRLRKQASDLAFELESKPKELTEVAQLIGCFKDNRDVQLAAVIQFADSDPRQFLSIANAPDRQARSLLKKALDMGEVKLKGKILVWNNETLGADEDEATQKLVKEKEVFKALEIAVKKKK